MNRRQFALAAAGLMLPAASRSAPAKLAAPVRLGLIADLHHDVMPDGLARAETFLKAMAGQKPDALIQLGDFAYPSAKNAKVIDAFNAAHPAALHVIGNHDTDAGHTKAQCLKVWGMPDRYYAKDVGGLTILVLDGNDKGSPRKGGYPSYVGEEQRDWLRDQLAKAAGPVIVVCHQPLAGALAIDNADEVQTILAEHAAKVLVCVNGHSHIDDVVRAKGVPHLHVNSASYSWVGGKHRHASYPKEVHAKHPSLASTCPYRDALFTTLTIDPQTLAVGVLGRASEWVGPSPAESGFDPGPTLTDGEEVAPRIRERRLARVAK